MRKLQLKSLTETNETWCEVIANVLSAPAGAHVGGGATFEEQMRTVPVKEKFVALLNAGQEESDIVLEDAEWELVNNRLSSFPWASNRRDILDMILEIKAAPRVTLESLSPTGPTPIERPDSGPPAA